MYTDNNDSSCINYIMWQYITVCTTTRKQCSGLVLDCTLISLTNTPASRLSSTRSTCRMQNCVFILNEA